MLGKYNDFFFSKIESFFLSGMLFFIDMIAKQKATTLFTLRIE